MENKSRQKQWILIAHIPFDDAKVAENGLSDCEWSVYGQSETARLVKKKEFLDTLYRAVFIRECSEALTDEEIASLA